MIFSLLSIVGCEVPETDSADADSAVSNVCDASLLASDVTVESTEVGTVFRLTWETATSTSSRVAFDNGEGMERYTVWDQEGTSHTALLVGLLPEAVIDWRVMVGGEAEESCAGTGELTTGAMPSGLPDLDVSVLDVGFVEPGLTAVPLLSTDPNNQWLSLLDESARWVWAKTPVNEMGMILSVTRMAFSRDGQGVNYLISATSADSPGEIVRMGFDGVVERSLPVNGLHTDFVELDDGRFAALVWEVRDIDGQRLLGDRVVVVDSAGVATSLWSSFDSIPVDTSINWVPGFYPSDPTVADWSHVNSIAYDQENSDILVTMTLDSGVASIDIETGQQNWLASTAAGDFLESDGAYPFALPHSVQALSETEILVFNRGDFLTNPQACSEAAAVDVDAESGQLESLRTWSGEECVLVSYLGQARALSRGNLEMNYSSAGRLEEFSKEGTLVRRIDLELGTAFGYSDHYQP